MCSSDLDLNNKALRTRIGAQDNLDIASVDPQKLTPNRLNLPGRGIALEALSPKAKSKRHSATYPRRVLYPKTPDRARSMR